MANSTSLTVGITAQDATVGRGFEVSRAFSQSLTGGLAGSTSYIVGSGTIVCALGTADSLNYSNGFALQNHSALYTVAVSITATSPLGGSATVTSLLAPNAILTWPNWTYVTAVSLVPLSTPITDSVSGQVYNITSATTPATIELVKF